LLRYQCAFQRIIPPLFCKEASLSFSAYCRTHKLTMQRGGEISFEERIQIVAEHGCGLKPKELAKRHKLPLSSIYYTLKRHRETGSNITRRRPGRPPIFGRSVHLAVKRMAVSDPFKSAASMSSDLKQVSHPAPSRRTVNRILVDRWKLKSRRPARKPWLDLKQRKRRKDFCRGMTQKPQAFWQSVMWSDEAKFEQFGSTKTVVRRPVGQRFNPRYTVPTTKHPPFVMVWGCFSASGRGALYFLPKGETMNGERYLKLLQGKLGIWARILRCKTFQQDGAPCHRSKRVHEFIRSQRLDLLTWPGNSADLSPIENLWKIVKDRVSARKPQNIPDLIQAIKRVWTQEVTPELCQKLALSVQNRMRLILRNNGYSCKY
jgi:hypothetical protein